VKTIEGSPGFTKSLRAMTSRVPGALIPMLWGTSCWAPGSTGGELRKIWKSPVAVSRTFGRKIGPSPACTAIAPGGALGASTEVVVTVIAEAVADAVAGAADGGDGLITDGGAFDGALASHPMSKTAATATAIARHTPDNIAAGVYITVVRRPRRGRTPSPPEDGPVYCKA